MFKYNYFYLSKFINHLNDIKKKRGFSSDSFLLNCCELSLYREISFKSHVLVSLGIEPRISELNSDVLTIIL